jgi:DNA invertase Pin-like site-specific DNA recombinase
MTKPSSKDSAAGTASRRAAIYVRMSSRPQDHSIQHQCDRLNEYAQQHGIEIVMMYADAGKSGLRINGRDGLQGLISDVQAGAPGFELVLVYDVSRWGRFQDVDESAHYEFICRQAGVQVVYCAEEFENDGSAMSSLLKGVKRTMAAEYSRELSAKVFAAQCKFVGMGFKIRASPGYGLRRMSFDSTGKRRRMLQPGERKAALTDRVRLCWGPEAEVAVVRRIFAMYLNNRYGDTKIAEILNLERIPAERGRSWTAFKVKNVLVGEKYKGCSVFNKRTAKLKTPVAFNEPAAVVRVDGALAPIISAELFEQAQLERQARLVPWQKEEILMLLRRLHDKCGKVDAKLIAAEPGYPAPRYIKEAFGTMADAYLLAGLPITKTLAYARTTRAVRKTLQATISAAKMLIEQAGGTHAQSPAKWCLQINDQLTLKVVVSRSRHDQRGRVRWRIPIHTAPVPDFVLCVQMDRANAAVLAYFLVPVADFTEGHIILRGERPDERAQYRYQSLAAIFGQVGASGFA